VHGVLLQDGELLGNTPEADGGDGTHNCQFTLESRSLVTLTSEDLKLKVSSSDDLFVFINGNLVVDLGGIHALETMTITIKDKAPALSVGDTFKLDLFYANRGTACKSGAPTPSAMPSATPPAVPSATPSASPAGQPSATPAGTPSATPSESPAGAPSATPSATPSGAPAGTPSATPSETPAGAPSATPSATPSDTPSAVPSATPSAAPTTPEFRIIQLPSWLRDFNAGDNDDFPPSASGDDTGFVNAMLGANKLPVYASGDGSTTTHGESTFNKWWTNVTTPAGDKRYQSTSVIWVQDASTGATTWSSAGYWPLVSDQPVLL
jgi:fibro-slime domain-containing protein